MERKGRTCHRRTAPPSSPVARCRPSSEKLTVTPSTPIACGRGRTAAARAIVGTRLEDAALDKLAAACSAACNPIDDKRGTIEYRTKVAGVLGKRAARLAFQRAGGA